MKTNKLAILCGVLLGAVVAVIGCLNRPPSGPGYSARSSADEYRDHAVFTKQ